MSPDFQLIRKEKTMTSEQVMEYAAMEKRVVAALREHGPQFILQLWARIILPEVQAVADGTRSDMTAYADVAAAVWRLVQRQAATYTEDQHIALA